MAISNGVVDASNITQHKYWRHLCEYVEHLRIKPPLQTTEVKEVILATTGFTDRFRRGYYRNGKRVTVQTPQVALSAISKTNDLGGGVSPIYRWDNKYITLIQRQIEGYRHKDPHPTHNLSVPVATINIAYKTGNKNNNAASEVSGKL